jgi:hypothetical protein
MDTRPHEVFDTQQDCEAELANRRASAATAARLTGTTKNIAEGPAGAGAGAALARDANERMKVARCVSTDDPELKKK